MNLYLVDDIEENVDPEFDAVLFVKAKTPQRAAQIWEDCFERGATVARVTLVPTPKFTGEGFVNWEDDANTFVVTL